MSPLSSPNLTPPSPSPSSLVPEAPAIAPWLPPSAPLRPAVYIVGAGPGDPELLTLRAVRILAQADVVLYADSLVPPQILQALKPSAEILPTASKTLEEILPLMIDRVKAGKSVVRLHSGDPCLYGAVHEQMQALTHVGIPFEVIPGISAFQTAAAKLRLELTVPGLVQTIILTRISGRTEVPEREELSTLAAHRASLCLYLAARHVQRAQDALLEHYDRDTPVGICYRLDWPDEQIWIVPLAEMAAVTVRENLIRTTLYVISPALGERVPLSDPKAPGQPSMPEETREDIAQALEGERRSQLYNPTHGHLFRPHRAEAKP